MADLVRVKCLAGWNFVRADRVIALQTSQTGATNILLEGGVSINSTELPSVIARRLSAAERKTLTPEADRVQPMQRVA